VNKFDRIYDLYRTLRDRRTPISIRALTERLECSEPTVKRSIQKLRDEFGAPITTVRGHGYLLADDGRAGMFELPGLWFNASELHALLSAHHLLSQVEPGILSQEIEPLKRRIRRILEHRRAGSTDLVRRVRIATTGNRPVDKHRFRQACTALMRRRRLAIDYHARGTDEHTRRQVSPQRLTHYRGNWYLDAWCHHRHDMRSFAFERIERLEAQQQTAREVSDDELDQFSRAYGIFSGPGRCRAVLRCSPKRARWLAEEQWHPDQTARWLPDGHYELTLPYDNSTELIMDILRHGPEIEVISPASLRQAVVKQLKTTLTRYVEDS
jgi:proteasome accessory factor C